MPPSASLSLTDVQRLLTDRGAQTRSDLASRLGDHLDEATGLTESERQIALDIVRHLARDVADEVRRALAEALKTSPHLPRDVARTMAADIDEVSLPVLEFSRVLTDGDLLAVIRAGDDQKQCAIARRETVASGLCATLAELGTAEVAATLAGNAGARLTEQTMNRLLDRHGTEEVAGRLARRAQLPGPVVERLCDVVSDQLRRYLVCRQRLTLHVADELLTHSRARAELALMGDAARDLPPAELCARLAEQGHLTPTLVVHALTLGDRAFFEAAMAHMAQIPIQSARLLISDVGPLGLRSLYRHTGMPEALYPVVQAAVQLDREMEAEGEPDDLQRRRRLVLERVLVRLEQRQDPEIDGLLKVLEALDAA